MVFNYYSCQHQHVITCTNAKIHSFNVPLQVLFCVNSNSLNLLLFVMNNISGSAYIGTVHQYSQCFDISPGIRRPGETQVNKEISTALLFLQHDQIMTFDWIWTGM